MNRIKELREKHHMSQVRLGIELEVTQETISAYEVEKHYPSAKTLIKMSELFSASIDYILGLSDTKMLIDTNNLSNDELKILSLFRELDTIQKNKTIAYMQGMLDNK